MLHKIATLLSCLGLTAILASPLAGSPAAAQNKQGPQGA